jgi:D-alanine-D-alanine ligase-like ATP-grasp enzyme
MTAARKVAVLKGGRSLERNVSLRSGAHAQEALARLGHEVVAIDADSQLVSRLHEAKPDAALIALHGPDGEDGRRCWRRSASRTPARGPPHACAPPTRCSPST